MQLPASPDAMGFKSRTWRRKIWGTTIDLKKERKNGNRMYLSSSGCLSVSICVYVCLSLSVVALLPPIPLTPSSLVHSGAAHKPSFPDRNSNEECTTNRAPMEECSPMEFCPIVMGQKAIAYIARRWWLKARIVTLSQTIAVDGAFAGCFAFRLPCHSKADLYTCRCVVHCSCN